MDITKENFPVLDLLLTDDNPMAPLVRTDFDAAAQGGDVEQYNFALGILPVVRDLTEQDLPGLTEDIRQKSLQSCRTVFDWVAQGNSSEAANAQYVLDEMNAMKLGL